MVECLPNGLDDPERIVIERAVLVRPGHSDMQPAALGHAARCPFGVRFGVNDSTEREMVIAVRGQAEGDLQLLVGPGERPRERENIARAQPAIP